MQNCRTKEDHPMFMKVVQTIGEKERRKKEKKKKNQNGTTNPGELETMFTFI